LTYRQSWINKFDRLIFYLLFLALLIYPTMFLVIVADFSSPNDRIFSIIVLFIILFALYGLYRKIFENRLTVIITDLTREKIKALLTVYFENKGYEFKAERYCIIARQDESLSFNNNYSKQITIIYKDNYVGFVMTKNFRKVSPPVFISHYIVLQHLRRLLTTTR
jgi:hypothetical protein